jgi:hypothetical protein
MPKCSWRDSGQACSEQARYLVAYPANPTFHPYCRPHMTRAVVQACDVEYRTNASGHRNVVQVLPTDERPAPRERAARR